MSLRNHAHVQRATGRRRTLRRGIVGVFGGAVFYAVAAVLLAGTAAAATPGTVGTTPANFTPWVLKTTPNQYVREIVPCGNLMYAVGTISAVGQGKSTYNRGNALSFSATTGLVTTWNPQVNGEVNSIAFSPDCSTAYLGGSFSSVHGTSATNIAAVSTSTGAVLTTFAHSANRVVDTVQYTAVGGILAGGEFTTINGVARTRLASLNPTTGAVTAYANLNIVGTYVNVNMKVYNSQLNHSGNKLLIEGVFTSIAGQSRQQVAVLDLGSSSVTVDGWNSPEFNSACNASESFYERAAAWSPDDSTIYAASTGYKPASGPGSSTSQPRAGLCDSVAAFPATSTTVAHKWINYTGCDSYYGVAADANNVYVTGHERWANNPNGCDAPGPGAVSRPGIASINPTTGLVTSWNPTRDLGDGGDDLTLTTAGLWVASDNFSNGQSQKCGGVTNHGGICFFAY